MRREVRADTPRQLRDAVARIVQDMYMAEHPQAIESRTEKLRSEGRERAYANVAEAVRTLDIAPLDPGAVTDEERMRAEFALSQADHAKTAILEYLEKVIHSAESLARDLKRRCEEIHARPHSGVGLSHANPEDLFAFALNDVENFARNVNLGHASCVATRYAVARVTLGGRNV